MNYRDGIGPRTLSGPAQSSEHSFLEHAIRGSVIGVVITDIDGTIEYANAAFSLLTGYDAAEVLGANTRIFASGLQDRDFYANLWNTVLAGEVWSGELRNRKKDGSLYWEALSISPVVVDGAVVRFIATKSDISEQKVLQEELLVAEEQARKASALKDAFLATISHEVRTPMNVILGFTQLLEDEYRSVIDVNDAFYFDSIREAAQRLLRTLDLMVNVSSAVSGNYRPVFEEYDLVDGMERLVQQFAPAAHEKRLYLEFRPLERIAISRIDRYAFEQSMLNLLDNAIRFTHDGGVFVGIEKRENSVCVDVLDTGEGMSPEFLTRIFEPFNQEDMGIGRRHEGLGLGLSLTKRYVELCHGSITVDSTKGKGTRFRVCLPCVT